MAMQVTGALLDACVLSVLTREDTYGYGLTQAVRGTLDISESTLYPVMRRLQSDECLTVYDVPNNGRNRRYYKITQRGQEVFQMYLEEWKQFKNRIDHLLEGEAS